MMCGSDDWNVWTPPFQSTPQKSYDYFFPTCLGSRFEDLPLEILMIIHAYTQLEKARYRGRISSFTSETKEMMYPAIYTMRFTVKICSLEFFDILFKY